MTRLAGKNAAASRVFGFGDEMEEQLLRRIMNGHLRLVDGRHVEYYHYGNRRWYRKKPIDNKGRATFKFGSRGHRTTVYRNRLVWVVTNKQAVSYDCNVDHEDGDKTNDNPDNLRLQTISESNAQGNGIQTAKSFHALWNWFHFVGLYGREPTKEEETDDSLLFV